MFSFPATWHNRHPLEIWQSQTVTDLLADFFEQNLRIAGAPDGTGRSYVLHAWEKMRSVAYEELRQRQLKVFTQMQKLDLEHTKEVEPIELIDLGEAEVFLDIGANKLSTINFFAKKFPHLKKLIGVDIIPQRKAFADPLRCVYYQVAADATSFPLAESSVDVINVQFVFHHFRDQKSIKRMLHICQNILKENGKLILWEESFLQNAFELSEAQVTTNHEQGIFTDLELTSRFYALPESERWQFILANDWLINVGNAHMPWTGQYYAWQEWKELLSEHGFFIREEKNYGLRVNGRIKQGVHMIGEFRKR